MNILYMIFYIQIVHGRLQTQSFLDMIEVQLRVLSKLLFQIKQFAWCLAWCCRGCGGAGGGCWGGGCGGATCHGCFHFFFFRGGATGKFAQITRGATEKSSHGADSATQARDEETTEGAGDGQPWADLGQVAAVNALPGCRVGDGDISVPVVALEHLGAEGHLASLLTELESRFDLLHVWHGVSSAGCLENSVHNIVRLVQSRCKGVLRESSFCSSNLAELIKKTAVHGSIKRGLCCECRLLLNDLDVLRIN